MQLAPSTAATTGNIKRPTLLCAWVLRNALSERKRALDQEDSTFIKQVRLALWFLLAFDNAARKRPFPSSSPCALTASWPFPLAPPSLNSIPLSLLPSCACAWSHPAVSSSKRATWEQPSIACGG